MAELIDVPGIAEVGRWHAGCSSSFTLVQTHNRPGELPRLGGFHSTEAGIFVGVVREMRDPKWPAAVFVRQARDVLEDL